MRSIGKSNAIVAKILNEPHIFRELIPGLNSDDPRIRMRVADAIEKVARIHPEIVQPYKKLILSEVKKAEQQEIQWHLAQILENLRLTARDRKEVIPALWNWLDHSASQIVRVATLQCLVSFSNLDKTLRPKVLHRMKTLSKSGSASLRARIRKLSRKYSWLKGRTRAPSRANQRFTS